MPYILTRQCFLNLGCGTNKNQYIKYFNKKWFLQKVVLSFQAKINFLYALITSDFMVLSGGIVREH